MVLMALDHVRDFFSSANVNPVDPEQSWPALFATRWVTHLCAPGFVALAGASVYLQRRGGARPGRLAWKLATRGLWLVFLEVTVISFAWTFLFPAPFLQVIWAIGIAMIVLAGLVALRLPVAAIAGIGWLILLLHNLLDPVQAASWGSYAVFFRLLHVTGMLEVHGRPIGFELYPVLPWIGVMLAGYGFGPLAAAAGHLRRRVALAIAAGFLTAFAALRVHNGYGDPIKFEHLASPARTAMSFLDVDKYPPSLEYVLATFGVLLVLYVLFDTMCARGWLAGPRRVVETYGRVPFFYYVPHIYLIHGAALLTSMALGQDWRFWVGYGYLQGLPDGWGYSLPVVYAIWAAVVAALYLPCRWFAGVKQRRRDWWLSYL